MTQALVIRRVDAHTIALHVTADWMACAIPYSLPTLQALFSLLLLSFSCSR